MWIAPVVATACLGFWHSASFAQPPANEEWVRATSRHFDVISNDGAKDVRKVARALERFRAFVRIRGHKTDDPERIKVFMFKNDESYRPYKRAPDGTHFDYIGAFHETRIGVYITMRADREEETFRTIYHEYTHYELSRASIPVPLWLHEGMAEYMSTFRTEDDKIILGEPIPHHVTWLVGRDLGPFRGVRFWLPLEHLFAVNRMSPQYNEDWRRGLFYAQSWAIFHYLRHRRPDLYEKIQALVEALNANMPATEAFETAFGEDYHSVRDDMEAYLFGEIEYHEISVTGLTLNEGATVERMSRSELLYELGDFLVNTSPWELRAAERHLREAVDLDPQHVRARAALATALVRRGKKVEAKQYFESAIEKAYDDDLPFYLYGMGLVHSLMTQNIDVRQLPMRLTSELREARSLLEHAIRLNPRRGDSYAVLGWTYLCDPGDTAPGVQALQLAHALMPKRVDVVYHLAALLVRRNEKKLALSLLDDVTPDATNAIWYVATKRLLHPSPQRELLNPFEAETKTLLEAALNESRREEHDRRWEMLSTAIEAYESGKYGRTLAILEQLSDVQDDVALQDQVEMLTASAQRMQTAARQLKMYRKAVRKAGSLEYQEATAILDSLLAEDIEDDKLERAARSLRQQLKGR